MMTPTIHLNGTSRAALREAYREAHDAVTTAIDKVALTAPNGRDYYPQGSDAIVTAGGEHRKRMSDLRAILDDLENLCIATMD